MNEIKKGDRVSWIEKLPTMGKKNFFINTDCVGVVEDILPEKKSVKVKVITKRYVERIGSDIAIISCGIISRGGSV